MIKGEPAAQPSFSSLLMELTLDDPLLGLVVSAPELRELSVQWPEAHCMLYDMNPLLIHPGASDMIWNNLTHEVIHRHRHTSEQFNLVN